MRCLQTESQFRETLRAALALGINHLETANGYGCSEVYLGQAIAAGVVPRDRVLVTTKIPPAADAEAFEQAIAASLRRLGLARIDGLALHGINTPEHLQQAVEVCLPVAERARARGQVGAIGFSTHAPLATILAAIATKAFEFVELHYYWLFPRNEAAIARAAARDMGIFIISPADKGGQLFAPPETWRELCAPYDPLALSYRWLLRDRRISTLSCGPAVPEELATVAAVANETGPLSPGEREAIARVDAAFAAGRDCSQCYACLPCPEGIHIPEVLRLRDLATSLAMTRYGQYRYRMFGNAGHWFPGVPGTACTDCGDCLPRCPEHLPIPSLLRDAHERLSGPPRRRLWEMGDTKD